MASTACGNDYGVAENCDLCAVKVLNKDGTGTWDGVIDGVDFVATECKQDDCCIANMSLGGGHYPALNMAMAQAVAAGVTFVV